MVDTEEQIKASSQELTRQLNIFSAQSTKAYKIILKAEKIKNDKIMEWTAAVQQFKYDDAKKLLLEYKIILERRERLPLNIYIRLIANHFIYIIGVLKKKGTYIPQEDLNNALKILLTAKKVQELLIKMYADVEEEMKTVEVAIERELPLKLLDNLKSDEVRDEALDREMQALRSNLLANYYEVRKRYGVKLAEAESKMKKMLGEWSIIKKMKGLATETYEEAYEFIGDTCAELQAEHEAHQITIKLAESAAKGIAGQASGVLGGTLSKLGGWIGAVSDIADQEKKYSDILEQIDNFRTDPKVDQYFKKHYQEALKKFETTRIDLSSYLNYFRQNRNP